MNLRCRLGLHDWFPIGWGHSRCLVCSLVRSEYPTARRRTRNIWNDGGRWADRQEATDE